MRHKGIATALLLGLAATNCADFDTTRVAPKPSTIGREVYTILCDRIGAQSFREDVTGASFHGICHGLGDGTYASALDLAKLPPLPSETVDVNGKRVTGEELRAARLRRAAKVEALGRQRERLVGAFDALLKDVELGAAEGCADAGKAQFLAAFRDALAKMFPLYDDGTVPRVTRAAGDAATLAKGNDKLLAALASIDGRVGYRPRSPGPSALYTLLSYPRLAPLARSFLSLVGDGDASDPKVKASFEALLDAARSELATLDTSPSPRGALSTVPAVDAASAAHPSRPRSPLEATRALLLHADDGYATGKSAPIVKRDTRGVAAVATVAGAVAAPFVDANRDGLADVDASGSFTSVGAAIASPFFAPNATDGRRDSQGFAVYDDGSRRLYDYLETQKTLLGAVVDRAAPLFARTSNADPSIVFDGLAALAVSAGPRSATPRTRTVNLPAVVQPTGSKQPPSATLAVSYKPFDASRSPFVALTGALGAVAAEPAFDEGLVVFDQLLRDKPEIVARFVDYLFKAKAIADAHPEARLATGETFWDDMFPVLERLAKDPAVLDDLMRAIATPQVSGIDTILVQFLNYRDHITYDANNLNGRNFNVDLNRALTGTELPYKTLVDRTQPDTGANRSAFQRFAQLLHDANGLAACTKAGAKVPLVTLGGLTVSYPDALGIFRGICVAQNPTPVCGILRINDIAKLLLDVALGRAQFDIRDTCLKTIASSNLLAPVSNSVLATLSGIDGLTLQPTVGGIARLAFFKTPWPGLPEETNTRVKRTKDFLSGILEPVPTMVCDATPYRDTDGRIVNLRRCQNTEDLMRVRDLDSLFALDEMDFVPKVRGLAAAFADHGQEDLFVDLFDTLHRHWGTERQTRTECDPTLPKSNARWCSQDGAMRYEPILAEALAPSLGLLPLAQEFIGHLKTMRIPHCTSVDTTTGRCTATTTRDGVTAFADFLKLMLDPARTPTLKNAKGEREAKRHDGTTLGNYSVAILASEALGDIDRLYAADANGAAKKLAWQKTRSLLVDRLFATQTVGASTSFKSAFLVPAGRNVIAELRGELDARCPKRRVGQSCDWTQNEWKQTVSDAIESPLTAAAVDLFDGVNQQPKPREEVDALLNYLVGDSTAGARLSLVGTLADALQWLDTGDAVTPLQVLGSQVLAGSVTDASGKVEAQGLARGLVNLFATLFELPSGTACSANAVDPHDVFATIAARLDAPMGERGESPLEAISGALFAVNRADPTATGALSKADYAGTFSEVEGFLLDRERGLEQIYAIVRQILAVQPQ
jgi:hypothetical protein